MLDWKWFRRPPDVIACPAVVWKWQCSTPQISGEQRTARIADGSPLFSWLSRSAAQVANNMRVGNFGKTSELRRRWRNTMAQFGEKVGFRTVGRRWCQFSCKPYDSRILCWCSFPNGVVRCKSWTRQPLNDAWDDANWNGLCGTPWLMVALGLKLTKQVTSDKEGARPPLPRIPHETTTEVEPRRVYVLFADIEAHGHTGGALASHKRAKNTQQFMSRTNQNHFCQNLDGEGKNECE